QDGRALPVTLADQEHPGSHRGTEHREQSKKAYARTTLVRDGADQGRHDRHEKARCPVGNTEPKRALRRRHTGVPELFEEQREEPRHHGGCKRRVGPIVHGPPEDGPTSQDPPPASAGRVGSGSAARARGRFTHVACSRVSWNVMSGQRSMVNCKLTLEGARY